MKALGIILILLIIGFLVYTQFIAVTTEEQQQVKDLRVEFDMNKRDFARAVRWAAEIGMDTTEDLAFAIRKAKDIRSKLRSLMPELTEEIAIERAENLKIDIDEFFKVNDLR
jgi:hypothetical protein